MKTVFMTAGVPALSAALYREIRFLAGDPAVLLEWEEPLEIAEGARAERFRDRRRTTRLLILRDIECRRACASAAVDFVAAPADFAPADGLSGDRETAVAQSAAEAVARYGTARVVADRTLPLIYAEMLRRRGIESVCDTERGIVERRQKDAAEIEEIRRSQHTVEIVMERICREILAAETDSDGFLLLDGEPLTSERVRARIDHALLDFGFVNPPSIVAGKKDGGDCHALGSGALRTGEPVIVDIFPQSNATLYYGDCTRTVVHGVTDPVYRRMFDAVKGAKAAATGAIRAGVTGEAVHRATIAALESFGYGYAKPGSDEAERFPRLTHGTGHGLGLACHEPPLLDFGGPELLEGDVVSIEPGLYDKRLGGVRIEDIVRVTRDGCENLGRLSEEIE